MIWDSYFLFMFWLSNFIRGDDWLWLGEREIEKWEENVSRNYTSDMWFLSRSHFLFSDLCCHPGFLQAGRDGARALLGCCSHPHPFSRDYDRAAIRGILPVLFPLVCSQSEPGKKLRNPAAVRPRPCHRRWRITASQRWRNSWRSRLSCSSPWEGPYPKPLAGPYKAHEVMPLLWLLWTYGQQYGNHPWMDYSRWTLLARAACQEGPIPWKCWYPIIPSAASHTALFCGLEQLMILVCISAWALI